MSDLFEPKIIGFLCNWCSYAGADLAGTSRIQYPPNLRVVRVRHSSTISRTRASTRSRTGRRRGPLSTRRGTGSRR